MDILGVAVLAGVVVALVLLTSNGGGTTSNAASSSARTSNAPSGTKHAARQPAVAPSSVTVAVLNGTATAGLAKRIASNLATAGYKQGTVTNAVEQTHTTTIVAYLPGFKRDATTVASSLKLRAAAVAPIDQATQAVACPPPAACTANVVVTVGSDLANTQ